MIDGQPYIVVEYEHQKYGRGSATIRLRIKNLKTGAAVDRTFKGKEVLEDADIEFGKAQFLYKRGNNFVFMDSTTFEQTEIPGEQMGGAAKFIKEGQTYDLMLIDGKPQTVKLPPKVVLKVTEAEPGIRGDSAQSPNKKATLETGAVIQVPLFVKASDSIRINTETGEYVERV